jgi:hypothetical protein
VKIATVPHIHVEITETTPPNTRKCFLKKKKKRKEKRKSD